ncbi:hypothetical protein C2G38_2027229 [Gigaspora rosea]|uniref:Uncharacterized protein n=1 Tax=Gigaspora rosea TaxID=44941 RepID=A0A397W7K9_9GLOM|nr:hypothetical protein C2G38_2027229 [Gigaspora rosea]
MKGIDHGMLDSICVFSSFGVLWSCFNNVYFLGIEETHSRSLLMNMKSWGLIFVFDIYDNPGSQNLGFEDNRQKFFFVKSSFVLVQFGVIFQIASNMPYGDFEGKVPKSLGQEASSSCFIDFRELHIGRAVVLRSNPSEGCSIKNFNFIPSSWVFFLFRIAVARVDFVCFPSRSKVILAFSV